MTTVRPGPSATSRTDEQAGTAASTTRRALPLTTLVLLACGLVGSVILSICVGSNPSTPGEVWHALLSPTGTDMDVTIREIRWPRTLTGIAAGLCLGVAGLLTQGHTRNALADPGLLGINQGAALAIVGTTFVLGAVGTSVKALLAFGGALVASVLVFAIGTAAKHGATPVTLVLAGAAVTALCHGVVTGLTLIDEASLDTLRFWQVGSLAARSHVIDSVWPFVLAGLVLAVLNIPALNALSLGEDVARSLGVSVFRARVVGIAAITLLAGSAVTMAGPIAFAGLLVPHLARAVCGADYRRSLPAAMCFGVIVLLLADTIGRVVARPGELSVGVVLAIIGAPFFVVLARRRRLVAL